MIARLALILSGITAPLLAACSSSAPTTATVRHTIARVDTLVAPESPTLESASDIVAAGDSLYVLTAGHQVVVLDTSGRIGHTFGREGGGPGEMRQARALSIAGNEIRAIDGGNGRLDVFDLAGKPIDAPKLPAEVLSGAAAVAADRTILVSTRGADSAQAVLLSLDGKIQQRFGVPGPPLPAFNMQQLKTEIAKGEIPPLLRAIVLPVVDPAGGAWLVAEADGTVTHFDRAGNAQWTAHLDTLPESRQIRATFFAQNRADSNASRLFTLNHVATAIPEGTRLLLLLRMPDEAGARLVTLDAAGRITSVDEVPGATGVRAFTVAPNGDAIYLLDYVHWALLRIRM